VPELEPIHPVVLLGILMLYGLKVLAQNDDNLVMARDIKDTNDIPIVVPKKAALVAVEII
jgi:hypothetical protein